MTPERWQELNHLLRSALEREHADRAAFLEDVINVGDWVQASAWAIFDDGEEENFTLALTWTSAPSSRTLPSSL